MTCPVCKLRTGYYQWPSTMDPNVMKMEAYPLYQRSYPKEPGYISPRCSRCYDKAERKLLRKL